MRMLSKGLYLRPVIQYSVNVTGTSQARYQVFHFMFNPVFK